METSSIIGLKMSLTRGHARTTRFLQAKNEGQKSTFELARAVVERSYPMEDVNTYEYPKKYGNPVM